MEPHLKMDADGRAALRELRDREPLFHRPELGTTRAAFEAMTAPDFWEVGASGRRYGRDYVLGVLERRQDEIEPDNWSTEDFHCRKIGLDVYLLTYTLFQGERETRRATLWKRVASGWQALYHQGTVVQD